MSNKSFNLLVIGSTEFTRRMAAATRQNQTLNSKQELIISVGNLSEAKSIVLSQRPDALLLDIDHKTSRVEVLWIKSLLKFFRGRFHKDLSIILAITAPEKFVHAGTLFFADEFSLTPSGLLDNLLITPPRGTSSALSLENQLIDCLGHILEISAVGQFGKNNSLPSLFDDAWVPVMCDPESRNVWMRWLPRYARYVNENPLIVGPTGSGKTRLAAAIHHLSSRRGPFISITPRDFSSTELVQAELFGAVSGAYTGAVEKWGLVQKADKGTLFIDELQSIDRDLQGKLITFIENKTYRRVGEAESHQADVRFVFATNRSLQELVEEGALRGDFAYRLERLQITLKPLEERKLDIAAGVCFALSKVLRERSLTRSSTANDIKVETMFTLQGVTQEAYQSLFSASWPGNLRQLENTIAKLIEIADIKNQTFIDAASVKEAIENMLGHRQYTSADILALASKKLIQETPSNHSQSLAQYSAALSKHARTLALDIALGDVKKAAELLNDSPKAMDIFAQTRQV